MTTATTGRPPAPAQPLLSSPPPLVSACAGQETADGGAWPRTVMPRAELARLALDLPAGSRQRGMRTNRRNAAGRMLAWLETFPGQTWQQRWQATGSEDLGLDWADAPAKFVVAGAPGQITPDVARRMVAVGMNALLCLGVLRPGYAWMFAGRFTDTYRHIRQLTDPEFFDQASGHARAAGQRERRVADALNHLAKIIMHTGKSPRQLTAGDLNRYHAAVNSTGRSGIAMSVAWDMLAAMKVIDAGPLSLRHRQRHGQRSAEELVDDHGLSCRPIRDLLVRYLKERAAAIDYGTLRGLAGILAGTFWKDLETHHPGISSLHLTPEMAEAWKQRAAVMRRRGYEGEPRTDRYQVLFVVRSFYLDLSQWALEDASWAPWVAPSPVRDADVRGSMKHQRHRTARMHQRTRVLAPVLPQLVASVEDYLHYMEKLSAAANAVTVGSVFTMDDVQFERTQSASDALPGKQTGARHLRVRRLDGGQMLDLTAGEDEAFWTWAIVETFRHTGIRCEELLEITHLALVTHTLPDTGEVVPMLQIAPSKQDTERLLLISPELAHVLARIVHRVRGGNERIPLVPRYDPHERIEGPPLPHLFQQRTSSGLRVIGPSLVKKLLDKALDRAGLRGPDGTPLRYTPHDFRRIFATEAVSGGLPVHIAAKLLGHRDLRTTQGYTAIYQDDVLRHYAAFIARRRALRPSEEYREPTDAEWAKFEQHFAVRKVELGTCARPYGSPCRHEHACIRCPMLRIDPQQGVRLAGIITSLHERIREATERGWLGEIEGLRVSLDAARQKMDQLRRTRLRGIPVEIGPGPPRR